MNDNLKALALKFLKQWELKDRNWPQYDASKEALMTAMDAAFGNRAALVINDKVIALGHIHGVGQILQMWDALPL